MSNCMLAALGWGLKTVYSYLLRKVKQTLYCLQRGSVSFLPTRVFQTICSTKLTVCVNAKQKWVRKMADQDTDGQFMGEFIQSISVIRSVSRFRKHSGRVGSSMSSQKTRSQCHALLAETAASKSPQNPHKSHCLHCLKTCLLWYSGSLWFKHRDVERGRKSLY